MVEVATIIAQRIRDRFASQKRIWGDYNIEMTLEALCEWHLADPDGNWLDAVHDVWARREWTPDHRIPWNSQPFASHNDALARARDDRIMAGAFMDETHDLFANAPCTVDGLVVHHHPRLPDEREPLLIDFMHEYAARLASAAALGGDPAWFDAAAKQFIGYRDILRDPDTGLWHLGRDWGEKPGALCPGAWSRGHGWLLRGLAETLRWMPPSHAAQPPLREILRETLTALHPLQDDEGMWHTLLHRPYEDSAPETSGTALIAYAAARAIADGHVSANPWSGMIRKAVQAVCARVDEVGIVRDACRGPGLLFDDSEALYLRRPNEPDDPHGAPCALYACLGAYVMRDAHG